MPKPTKWVILRTRVVWILILLLVPSFIVFFHAAGRTPGQGPGGVAGRLFGTEVPWETFEDQREWTRRQLQGRLGARQDEMLPLLDELTWEKLMLIEEAKRTGLTVQDQEVAELIQQLPDFQEDGRFVPERYHRLLRASGLAPQRFERWLRNDLLVEKLMDTVRSLVVVTDEELRRAYAEAHERRTGSVLFIKTASYTAAAAAELTEDALRAFYEANREALRIPEHLTIEYAGNTRSELADSVTVAEEDLQRGYEEQWAELAGADGASRPFEEVREQLRQRLTDRRILEALTELALDLEDRLRQGLRYEEILVAEQLTSRSIGPFPAGQPWLSGAPDPALVERVSTLAEGRLTDVIETETGVYLARVTERRPSRIPAFKEVRERVLAQAAEERARQTARAKAEQLRAHLLERQSAGLRFEEAVALEALDARTARFTRRDPIEPIGRVPAVTEAAFATPPGSLTEVIETPDGFVFIRVEESDPADESRFAEERDEFQEELLQERLAARVNEWFQEVRTRAQLERPPAG